MNYLHVKNWREFQHYPEGSRKILWIKLYTGLLTDFDFCSMPEASQLHLIKIWLLAVEMDGKVPADPLWISARIAAREPVDIAAFVERGFLLADFDVLASNSADTVLKSLRENKKVKQSEEDHPGFDAFYASYPKRRDKPAAKRAWNKLKPPVGLVMDSVAIWSKTDDWTKEGGKYVPYPATWLNANGWEDEPTSNAPPPPKSAYQQMQEAHARGDL